MQDSSRDSGEGTVVVALREAYQASAQVRGCSVLFLVLAGLSLLFALLVLITEGRDDALGT